MRDEEFKKVYLKAVPKLRAYFYTCLKNEKCRLPYEPIIKTLVDMTRYAAFMNSRKESLSGYCIEALIWKKAQNVWYEHVHPRRSRIVPLDTIDEPISCETNALYRMIVKERLEILKPKIEPKEWEIIELLADGLSYRAIAESLDQTEGAVKMKMHRLRKRLETELAKLY
jgi:ATP/maltotriose-dependent transcriptional regulator MalT